MNVPQYSAVPAHSPAHADGPDGHGHAADGHAARNAARRRRAAHARPGRLCVVVVRVRCAVCVYCGVVGVVCVCDDGRTLLFKTAGWFPFESLIKEIIASLLEVMFKSKESERGKGKERER